jgi:hypothetical protein
VAPQAVLLSAIVVAAGAPIVGLAIAVLIPRITWEGWNTMRGHRAQH